jgi:RNase H-fold protein (predicted Holliday junction resolvase)
VKKVVGLDLGTRSCGIAISDTLGIAHPREEFRFLEGAYKQCLSHVIELLHKEGVNEVALGYPLNMDGSAGESAHRSERFKEEALGLRSHSSSHARRRKTDDGDGFAPSPRSRSLAFEAAWGH